MSPTERASRQGNEGDVARPPREPDGHERRADAGTGPKSAKAARYVKVGTQEIAEGIREISLTTAINSDAQQRVVIDRAQLAVGSPEYRGSLEIWTDPEKAVGWVTAASVDADTVALEARTGVDLNEKLVNMATSGVDHNEIAWSMARLAGFPEDRLKIPGLKRLSDTFEVVMSIRGISNDLRGIQVGPVRLDRDLAKAQDLTEFLPKARIQDRREFLAPGWWAWVGLEDDLLVEADRNGVALIEAALDRITLASQYSLSYAPDGSVPSFERDSLFADPRAAPAVLVSARTTNRRWFRVFD